MFVEPQKPRVPEPLDPTRIYLAHRSAGNIVGYCWVDPELHPFLTELSPWFLNRTGRKLMPPRKPVQARDEKGFPYQFNLLLHRVVVVLMTTPEEDRLKVVSNIAELWNKTSVLPKINFLDKHVLNCTFGNLDTSIGERAIAKRRLEGLYGLGLEQSNTHGPLIMPVEIVPQPPVQQFTPEEQEIIENFIPEPEPSISELLKAKLTKRENEQNESK